MTTQTQFVFPHPYFDMVCNHLANFDYREQYKRLNELYVWLAYCVQEDIRVQISRCLVIGRTEMNFELWVWGDGVDIGLSNYKVINTWQDEPTHKTVRAECEFYLGCLGFEACKPVFPASSYDVLKDGEWKRVYFMLWEI